MLRVLDRDDSRGTMIPIKELLVYSCHSWLNRIVSILQPQLVEQNCGFTNSRIPFQ